jgi:tripartite-type tricarboxylate transporter receptor subunit TctC
MTTPKSRRTVVAQIAAMAAASAAFAQTPAWPSKTITIVVPYPAGGAADLTGRLIAEKLRTQLGQSVIVENRAGANGLVGSLSVVRSAPDGYTLLLAPREVFGINAVLQPQQAPDWRKDYAYVGIAATGPYALIVNPRLGVTSMRELQAVARTRELNYSSFGKGSMAHLNIEALAKLLGVKMNHVPYRGSAPAVTAVATGEVDLSISTPPAAMPFMQDGKIRAIGAGGGKRIAQMPDVPTMAEQGYAEDPLISVYFAMAAPAGTPAAITERLSRELAIAVRQPDVEAKFTANGLVVSPGTPQEMAASVADDAERFGKLVKELGITVE